MKRLLLDSTHHPMSAIRLGKSVATGLTLGALAALSVSAYAEPTGYNQLSFSAEAKSEVANDEVQARLYKKVQARDAKTLARKLNTAVNKAMTIAKQYPSVTVSSGSQNTYPRYNDDEKIIGWTGRANIQLKSTDLTAASQLIADLQKTMVMGNLSFGISEPKKKATERQLMMRASKAFQDQAKSLTSAWGAKGYRIINVNLNTGRHHPRPIAVPMAMEVSRDASVPAPNFESGNSTVTVIANGTIEMAR